jgi:cyclic beta-1,2-glucan synthetase
VLLSAYRAIAAATGEGRAISPAAEWLLDNYHLVEEQIREIRQDLPPSFYRLLPKLGNGPFEGYPPTPTVASTPNHCVLSCGLISAYNH